MTIHVLWNCPAARDVWCVRAKIFQKSCLDGPVFMKLVEDMIRICSKEEFTQFLGIAWRI